MGYNPKFESCRGMMVGYNVITSIKNFSKNFSKKIRKCQNYFLSLHINAITKYNFLKISDK